MHTGLRLLIAALIAFGLAGISAAGPQPVAAHTLAQASTAPPPNISYFGCQGGQADYYTVPANTSWLAIIAWGGAGHSVRGASGALGASVNAKVPVTPGQRLAVNVGCAGGSPWDNGLGFAFGGGGGFSTLENSGGGGGAASGVQLCPTGSCDFAGPQANILVVAGGGGGGGGKSEAADGGDGGTGSATGDRGHSGDGTNHASGGGGGASSLANGTGANGWGSTGGGGGGGGGGGYPRGGDGGRGGSCLGCGGGGGGGGASYTISTATSVKIGDGGARRGHGLVIITPVRPTQPVPTAGVFQCSGGNVQTYTVPGGVTSIQAVAVGAQGGTGDNSLGGNGGAGALVSGTLAASPGTQFGVMTGCSNGGNSGAGYGSGGRGGANSVIMTRAGGGGGGSAVLSAPTKSANPLLVAGGGGGAGDGQYSGSGGYNSSTGLNGQPGLSAPLGASGGSGGTAGAASGRDGTNGRGSDCPLGGGGGGGGGGGYPKGGLGGGVADCSAGGGGGGAGSSFADAMVGNLVNTPGGGGTSGGLVLMIAAPPGPPMAPTNVVATGTDRGATVTFTTPADDGGMPITSYTVRSTPGNFSINSRINGPIVFAGLTNGTTYTFTVVATNAVGDSAPSAPSNPVTPRPFPGQPTITSVTAGDGGSAITSYTVASNPDGITATGTASPITLTGLTNGVSYTFTVVANNAVGGSQPSQASNAVTPSAALPPANDNFANAQVITGNSGTVTGTNVNATTEAGEPGPAGASVWYALSVTNGGVLQIDTCGSSFSPAVAAYTGSAVSALTPLASGPVGVFCGATGTFISGIQVALPPNGGTIYIAVDGGVPSNPVTGSITLHWGAGG